MGLFESKEYQKRNLVETELERRFREVEEKKEKISKTDIAVLQGVYDFAIGAKLLKAQQMEMFQKRLRQIAYDESYRKNFREVAGVVVDGYENPIESAKRFTSLEQVQSQIESERENGGVTNSNEKKNTSQKSNEDDERSR